MRKFVDISLTESDFGGFTVVGNLGRDIGDPPINTEDITIDGDGWVSVFVASDYVSDAQVNEALEIVGGKEVARG